jgi:hypothetical protein
MHFEQLFWLVGLLLSKKCTYPVEKRIALNEETMQ